MMRSRVPALMVALCMSGWASAALADDQNPMADVVCSRQTDLAEVRVGWEDDCYIKGQTCLRTFSQLPLRLDEGLSRAAPTLPFHPFFQGQCTLSNGTEVRVRLDDDAKQATGFGGADPSAYLTVWVGKQKVLSRSMVYAGHGTDNPWVAAILVKGSKVTFCSRSDDEVQEATRPVNCADNPPAFHDLPLLVSAPSGNRDFPYKLEITPEEGPTNPAITQRYTPIFAACQKRAVTTQDNAACFAAEFTRQDATLNHVWRETLNHLPAATRPALLAAQRKWIAARDPFCKSDVEGFGAGTIAPVAYVDCRVELTIRRTMWLEQLH